MTDGRVLRIWLKKLTGADRDPSLSAGDREASQRSQVWERGAASITPSANLAATTGGAVSKA